MPLKAWLWNVDSGNRVVFNLLLNINLVWTFFFCKAEITLKMQLYCVVVALWCIIVPYHTAHVVRLSSKSIYFLYLCLSHTHGRSELRPVRSYRVQRQSYRLGHNETTLLHPVGSHVHVLSLWEEVRVPGEWVHMHPTSKLHYREGLTPYEQWLKSS